MIIDAKKNIENILGRESNRQFHAKLKCYEEYRDLNKKVRFDDYKNDNSIIFLPKDMPEIINSGETQAIIHLDENYIAKIPILKFNNYYMITEYPNIITDSMNTWKELGFNVLPHVFYTIGNGGKKIHEYGTTPERNPRLSIAPNLAKNGLYDVNTYDEKNISGLKNADQIKKEFEKGFQKIIQIYDNPENYALQTTGHVEYDGKIDTAITHMFLTQIDKKNNHGKLYLADLDHLFIYKLD